MSQQCRHNSQANNARYTTKLLFKSSATISSASNMHQTLAPSQSVSDHRLSKSFQPTTTTNSYVIHPTSAATSTRNSNSSHQPIPSRTQQHQQLEPITSRTQQQLEQSRPTHNNNRDSHANNTRYKTTPLFKSSAHETIVSNRQQLELVKSSAHEIRVSNRQQLGFKTSSHQPTTTKTATSFILQ